MAQLQVVLYANATEAAFKRNVEFVVRLDGTHHATSLATVRNQLLGEDGDGAIFERVLPSDLTKATGDASALDIFHLHLLHLVRQRLRLLVGWPYWRDFELDGF